MTVTTVAAAGAAILTATLVAPAESSGAAEPNPPGLQPLFEATLELDETLGEPSVAENRFDQGFSMSRDLVAQGEGRIRGARLVGETRYSALARRVEGEPYARTLVSGWIDTDSSAEVFFEAVGFAALDEHHSLAGATFSATVRFEAYDPDTEWLNSVPAVWVGRFDPEHERLVFTAYSPRPPAP